MILNQRENMFKDNENSIEETLISAKNMLELIQQKSLKVEKYTQKKKLKLKEKEKEKEKEK